jgi:hypothetical protein
MIQDVVCFLASSMVDNVNDKVIIPKCFEPNVGIDFHIHLFTCYYLIIIFISAHV